MEIKTRLDVYKELFSDLLLNHHKRIINFSTFEVEYKSFYNYASVYDSSHSSIFHVTGKDAIDFLHRISTNNLINLPDYSSQVTLFLNEKGRIVEKLKIFKFPDYLIMIGSPENDQKIARWIERYAVMDEIAVKQVNDNYIYLKIFGKKVDVFFTLLFGDQLKYLESGVINKYINDQFQCWLVKDEVLGQNLGYEIICDQIYGENLLRYIYSNLKTFNCQFIGYNTYETIRIEQGEVAFPFELNDSFNPYEVNQIKYVDFKKGCYIGQEVIARLETYEKVKYNFKGFILERAYNFENNMIYKTDGSEVGELTSNTYSPELKKYVALGILSNKLSDDDLDQLYVKEGNEQIKIKVTNLPMVKL